MKITKLHEFFLYRGEENYLKKTSYLFKQTNIKILKSTFIASVILLAFAINVNAQKVDDTSGKSTVKRVNIGGYFIVQRKDVDESYNAGFSNYTAIWSLLKEYPGRDFQTGLFGTWMHPQNDGPLPIPKLYTDIEGGSGWSRETRFPSNSPKFRMGGVQLNFAGWANGPGAGRGDDWNNPKGQYGVVQLSPWIMFPPDGLNLKQGTNGELFGYGYLPLPLTEPKTVTAGKDIVTGNQCWTLFLNTGNFKGPVAFFAPYFWSKASVSDPRLNGLFLDTRPSKANKPFQMETQYIYAFEATDPKGEKYVRMAPARFPVDSEGNSVVMNRLMVYNKTALWDGVKAWFDGGNPVSGKFNLEGAEQHKFTGKIRSSWSVFGKEIPKNKRAPLNINTFLSVVSKDSSILKLKWESNLITRESDKLLTLPQYYHFVKDGKDTLGKWIAVDPKEVPTETGLQNVSFSRGKETPPKPFITPEDKESSWKKPGPVAGPFKAKLGDGSTVTYYWYRFADQPALLNADMTTQEREELQKRVEKLHRYWTKDREYLPPPTTGKLADIDPAQIVTPPKGLEVGYVPIITRQAME